MGKAVGSLRLQLRNRYASRSRHKSKSKMLAPPTACNTTTDNSDVLSAPALTLRGAIAALKPIRNGIPLHSVLIRTRPASLDGAKAMPCLQAPFDRSDHPLCLSNILDLALAIVAEAMEDLESASSGDAAPS
jgi:hypothetical protein